MSISEEIRQKLLTYQKNEITEHHIYRRLARIVRSPENRRILEEIADDELRHYGEWRTHTQQDVAPDRLSIWKYYLISRVFGFMLVLSVPGNLPLRRADPVTKESRRGVVKRLRRAFVDLREVGRRRTGSWRLREKKAGASLVGRFRVRCLC